MKFNNKKIAIAFSSMILLTSCIQEESSVVESIDIAHSQAYVPYDYVDDEGISTGFEVDVMREVDKLLEDYEFNFIPTSDEDVLMGVEAGKYDVGIKGVWYTEERAKKFIFPQNQIGASVIGLAIRAEDADEITDMKSFAEYSGKLVPISPQSAQYTVIEEYNSEHEDAPIELVPSDTFDINDSYAWVLEGRYDGYLNIKLSYENNVIAEDGVYHDFNDDLAFVTYKAIGTYPLFNKENQELADAYDKAFEELYENGTLSKLSLEYFKEDVFQLTE
ncbi:MAG: transporter substrate-binding domain-containing protein [Lachnospirales bacterium]